MKNSKISTLTIISILFITACSTNTRTLSNSGLDSDNADQESQSDLGTNPLADADPTEDLFDTEEEEIPTTTTTTTTTPVADASATACMSNDNAWTGGTSNTTSTSQWMCLNNSASQGYVGQDTIMNLAAASIGMMNSCGLVVRQELIARMAALQTPNQAKITELFQLAKVKLTQCYYRVVNQQSGSMQWAPYQSQVYGYNAGNIYNLYSGFNQ